MINDIRHLSWALPGPHSWSITGVVAGASRQVPLVEQELLILPEHLRSPPVFSGVRVTRSLVYCVVFCRSLFFSFLFWPWLSLNSRFLITPLVSSNFSLLIIVRNCVHLIINQPKRNPKEAIKTQSLEVSKIKKNKKNFEKLPKLIFRSFSYFLFFLFSKLQVTVIKTKIQRHGENLTQDTEQRKQYSTKK